jgi:hypothetical protein
VRASMSFRCAATGEAAMYAVVEFMSCVCRYELSC